MSMEPEPDGANIIALCWALKPSNNVFHSLSISWTEKKKDNFRKLAWKLFFLIILNYFLNLFYLLKLS